MGRHFTPSWEVLSPFASTPAFMRSLHKMCLHEFCIDVCSEIGSLPQRKGGSKSRFGNETSPPGFAIGCRVVVLMFSGLSSSSPRKKLSVGFLNQYIVIFTANAQINTSRSCDEDTSSSQCGVGTVGHYKI